MPRMKALKLYEKLVIDRPLWSLLLLGLVLVGFGSWIPQFKMDVSADSLVLENDADLEYYRNIRARYGSDDYLIVTYTPNDKLFSEENLSRVAEMRDRFKKVERVESVLSMLDVPLVESPPINLDQFSEGAPMLSHPETDRQLARKELTTSPLFSNNLVNPEGDTCAIQIVLSRDQTHQKLMQARNELRIKKLSDEFTKEDAVKLRKAESDYDQYREVLMAQEDQLIAEVRAIIDDYRSFGRLHLGGAPMVISDMMSFIRHDISVFGIAVLLILASMLLLIFHRPHWVLLPLLSAAATGIVTTGFLGIAGWPVTVVSSNFLALVLIFSLSLTIHLIVRYRELHSEHPDAEQRFLVSTTIRNKAAPCLFNALTTMVAFGSLVVSDIRPVIDFGWIMMFAVGAAMLLTFTLFPSALMLLKPGDPQKRWDVMGGIAHAMAKLTDRHAGLTIAAALLLAILGGIGMSKLTVENRFIDNFDSSTEIFQGMLLIDEKLGGTTPLDVIIDAPAAAAEEDPYADEWEEEESSFATRSYWYNANKLEEVGKIHEFLDDLPETGKVMSMHTTMQLLDKLNEGELINSFFLSLLHKKVPDDVKAQVMDPYLSEDGQQVRFSIRVYESDRGLNRNDLIEKIRSHLEAERGPLGEEVHISGMVKLYNNLLQSLFSSQIQTLGFVFLAIFITFIFLFRSLIIAMISIVPNLIPVVLVLGLLGGLGIPLDIMTITIAAITVGIAVDDTIHYVHRYREEWEKDGDYRQAVFRAHNSIGRAMYYTTVTVSIGFVAMVLSDFVPTIYFGLFTAFSMLSALLVNMTVLPILLRTIKPYGKL